MKILISDYPDSMMPTHDYEMEILKNGFPDCEIVIYEYHDEKREEFLEIIEDVDAILTGFIKIDEEAMDKAKKLKIISMNATGYDNIDLKAANKRGIGVCPVGEYCTIDVAEFTIGMIFSLVKQVKILTKDVEQNFKWRYDVAGANPRIENLTLGIFGLGKIGRTVAKKASLLGMKVLAYDPYVNKDLVNNNEVELVEDMNYLLSHSDVISNHMNYNKTNDKFFNLNIFKQMSKIPFFINMGRGNSVEEDDLVRALDVGYLKGAALDVLKDETPHLENHPLIGRDNVIVTPHAAFYTINSIKDLQKISTENIVFYLKGDKDKVFKLVSDY
ncbi:D-3-phosphoglycerate dehydrogenase [Ignavigranum ruoffiae]|uniref:D-3-phosphoglycerate dehydrogenase n=1 Tax=Ignavigranum ruoffiae TaxID=89093 RepID=A0A1H9B3C1_9LACT|nr:NAD(P)-dependent oxidoreductase [Ignavigranum ruoffiae]SEP83550.1 D-3-phosphoglycerate dehydrogenase [Ignavigranum ruoffiae]